MINRLKKNKWINGIIFHIVFNIKISIFLDLSSYFFKYHLVYLDIIYYGRILKKFLLNYDKSKIILSVYCVCVYFKRSINCFNIIKDHKIKEMEQKMTAKIDIHTNVHVYIYIYTYV